MGLDAAWDEVDGASHAAWDWAPGYKVPSSLVGRFGVAEEDRTT